MVCEPLCIAARSAVVKSTMRAHCR